MLLKPLGTYGRSTCRTLLWGWGFGTAEQREVWGSHPGVSRNQSTFRLLNKQSSLSEPWVAYNDNYFTLKLWDLRGIRIYLNHSSTHGTTVSPGRGSSWDGWHTAQQWGGAARLGLPKGSWPARECLDKWPHEWLTGLEVRATARREQQLGLDLHFFHFYRLRWVPRQVATSDLGRSALSASLLF